MISLDELFDEAQKFGIIHVYQHDDKTWSAKIEFSTIDHVKLEAKSGFNHKTVKIALSLALENAIIIVESMRSNAPESTKSTQEKLGITQKIAGMLGVRL